MTHVLSVVKATDVPNEYAPKRDAALGDLRHIPDDGAKKTPSSRNPAMIRGQKRRLAVALLLPCIDDVDDLTPTWEWRYFAADLPPLNVALPSAFETADRTYIISPESDTRAAFAGNLLSIDVLDDRHNGLELWRPALRAAFPLCQHDVRDAIRQFDITPPTLYRAEYTPFEFMTDVATCTNGFRVIGVRGLYRCVDVDSCTVERATVTTMGRVLQSIAISGLDPDAVHRVLFRLGLDGFGNVSVVRLLETLLGIPVSAERILEAIS